MRTETIDLPPLAPGVTPGLTVHRFGRPGARPLAYIQAALHADEVPGMLAAHHLRERLARLDDEGGVVGEVVLVPVANPIGLAQRVLGQPHGRFDLGDGRNFNRGYPQLTDAVAEAVAGRLGEDAAANGGLIGTALREAVAAWPVATPAEHLKRALLGLAVAADLVLDLHCDSEAAVHLYTLTPMAEAFAPLSALLGCEAVLLATESGEEPFDEAVSRPWHELRERFRDRPIPLDGLAATVELRGQADVTHEFGRADAAAIIAFLNLRGVLAGPAPEIPPARCEPTPLAGSEPLVAPASGIVVFHREVGARVVEGEAVAEIIDPLTAAVTPVRAATSGVLFARVSARFALAGRRLGKVAGREARRTGPLLSA